MENVMIDIETLGTESGSAILSIAAVEFCLKTGSIGRKFYKKIDLQSSLSAGLQISSETLLWWMGQKQEVFKELFNETEPLTEVLKQLVYWFQPHNVYVWANSPAFDLVLLENALKKCALIIPWKFYNERCVRTLLSLAPESKENVSKPTDAHNALNDCLFQINYCVAVNKVINNRL